MAWSNFVASGSMLYISEGTLFVVWTCCEDDTKTFLCCYQCGQLISINDYGVLGRISTSVERTKRHLCNSNRGIWYYNLWYCVSCAQTRDDVKIIKNRAKPWTSFILEGPNCRAIWFRFDESPERYTEIIGVIFQITSFAIASFQSPYR